MRLAATRSAASGACRAGHVRVNGVRVKPAHAVRAGDEVRLRGDGRERVVVVQQVITKRVSASVAAGCYIDNSPPPPPREEAVPVAARDRGAGRPTKRERRSIDKLLGRPARCAGFAAAPRRPGCRAVLRVLLPAEPYAAGISVRIDPAVAAVAAARPSLILTRRGVRAGGEKAACERSAAS